LWYDTLLSPILQSLVLLRVVINIKIQVVVKTD